MGRTAWTMTLEMMERLVPARQEKQRRALGFGGSQPRQHHVAWAAFKGGEDTLD